MNVESERPGVLRLILTANARYKAAVIAAADDDELIRQFILDQVGERPLFLARPCPPTPGETEYLILGKRCVLNAVLWESTRRSRIETYPAGLYVTSIRELDETVLNQLRPLSYEPDSSKFEIKVLIGREERYYTEFVYELVASVDWANHGHRITESIDKIIDSGPRMPSDSWKLIEQSGTES